MKNERVIPLIHSMLSHCSIRAYRDRPMPDALLEQMIQATQAAPSWVILQHVSIIAVKAPARRDTNVVQAGFPVTRSAAQGAEPDIVAWLAGLGYAG